MFALVASLSCSIGRTEQIVVVVLLCCQKMDSAKDRAMREFHGPGKFLGVIAFCGFCQNVALVCFASAAGNGDGPEPTQMIHSSNPTSPRPAGRIELTRTNLWAEIGR